MKIVMVLLVVLFGCAMFSAELSAQPRPDKELDVPYEVSIDSDGVWAALRIGWMKSGLFTGPSFLQHYGISATYMYQPVFAGLHFMFGMQKEFDGSQEMRSYVELGVRFGCSVKIKKNVWLSLAAVPSYGYREDGFGDTLVVGVSAYSAPIELGPFIKVSPYFGVGANAYYTPTTLPKASPLYGFYVDFRFGKMPE